MNIDLIKLPQYSLRSVVLNDLVFYVNLMRIPLCDGQKRVFPVRYLPLKNAVVTRDVPGIDTGVVRRLDPTRSRIASLQHPIAVGSLHQVTPPTGHAPISVPQIRFDSS